MISRTVSVRAAGHADAFGKPPLRRRHANHHLAADSVILLHTGHLRLDHQRGPARCRRSQSSRANRDRGRSAAWHGPQRTSLMPPGTRPSGTSGADPADIDSRAPPPRPRPPAAAQSSARAPPAFTGPPPASPIAIVPGTIAAVRGKAGRSALGGRMKVHVGPQVPGEQQREPAGVRVDADQHLWRGAPQFHGAGFQQERQFSRVGRRRSSTSMTIRCASAASAGSMVTAGARQPEPGTTAGLPDGLDRRPHLFARCRRHPAARGPPGLRAARQSAPTVPG